MTRDKLLLQKDAVQRKLWKEAGQSVSQYVSLIHERASKLSAKVGKTRRSTRHASSVV
jgi:hypothetical protein